MNRPSIDEYYLSLLPLVAARATCPRRKVAAILVDAGGKLVSIGYNGVPSGMPHCIDEPCDGARDPSGDTSRCIAIHAEVNALSQARASLRKPHALYCSTTPCFECAKILVTEGVRRVVAASRYTNTMGVDLLRRAGVTICVEDGRAPGEFENNKEEMSMNPGERQSTGDWLSVYFKGPRPKIVCLCGSTRFWETFRDHGLRLTMEGHIVLSIGIHAPDSMVLAHPDTDEGKEQKRRLDVLHKRKIDLCDEVLVLNVHGYIGDSTRGEVEYARTIGRPVRWLEPENAVEATRAEGGAV